MLISYSPAKLGLNKEREATLRPLFKTSSKCTDYSMYFYQLQIIAYNVTKYSEHSDF